MLNLIEFIFNANKQDKPAIISHLVELSGEAIVDEAIRPYRKGRCRWKGSYWFARCELEITIAPDDVVEVVGIENITLLVRPIGDRQVWHQPDRTESWEQPPPQ